METSANDAPGDEVTQVMPRRRMDLCVEELDGETVLYDPESGAIHRFNATTSRVWNACDGKRSMDEIAARLHEGHEVSRDEALGLVREALALCAREGLLEVDSAGSADEIILDAPPNSARAYSRRELLHGGLSGAILAAPLISTFFTTGALAASGASASGPGGCKRVGYSCVVNTDCCEGGTDTACQDQGQPTKTCCVQHLRPGCVENNDCCNGGDICNAGTCQ